MRADHGNVQTSRAQWEEAGVLGEHDRATGQLLGDVTPLSGDRGDVDPLGRVGVLEQPDLELRAQHSTDAAVDVPDIDGSALDLRGEHVAVPERVGELHVQSGLDRQPACLGGVGRGLLLVHQPLDRAVVGGDESLEPQGVAQQVLEYLR